jgi:hypothetical protein
VPSTVFTFYSFGLTRFHRLNGEESVSERALRLKNVQAFEAFEELVPGFSATINRFENNPDLMDEFANIASCILLPNNCMC